VEVAFLIGELVEVIYMYCPEGLEHQEDEVTILDKSMYGLVQSARQFNLKLSQILRKIGFEQSHADPCLFYKGTGRDCVYLVVHVDDCYVVGDLKLIQATITDIEKEGLKLKVAYDTHDYLSCEIVLSDDKKSAWLGQPHMIMKLVTQYGELVNGNITYRTPGTPGYGIVRTSIKE
jgi:hypothetical protein